MYFVTCYKSLSIEGSKEVIDSASPIQHDFITFYQLVSTFSTQESQDCSSRWIILWGRQERVNESLINTQVVNNYSLVCQKATRLLNLIMGQMLKLNYSQIKYVFFFCYAMTGWRKGLGYRRRGGLPPCLDRYSLGVCANNLRIATKWKAFEMLGIPMCSTSNDLTKLLLMHVDRYNDQTSSSSSSPRGFSQRTTQRWDKFISLFKYCYTRALLCA